MAASAAATIAQPAALDLDDRIDAPLQRGLESVVRELGLTAEVSRRAGCRSRLSTSPGAMRRGSR
jgi:hypothetical protein